MVDGVDYKTNVNIYTDYCDYHNGQDIKVAYNPKDIHGTATTEVYKFNLHPVAMVLMVIGSATAGGVWLLSYTADKPLKVWRRKR
jgi:1,4-dihydroxy-2-naphthoate octaprenyltransferase